MDKTYFITGVAGFIGFHTAISLLAAGHRVVGVDNLNTYYDPRLKQARFDLLKDKGVELHAADLADRPAIAELFGKVKPHVVIHLAAQAGVRYSIDNPMAYLDSNLAGFMTVLEGCRHNAVEHLVYASSSSVYGANHTYPFSEDDTVDHPVSLYAATKKANEALAHSYAHLYRLPVTGLRFFTVYGPWGRPDMAYFSFTQKILAGEPIPVFNNGKMQRDFTYIDDIVRGILAVATQPASPNPDWNPNAPDPATSLAPWRIYNIGNNTPTELEHFINVLEDSLGQKAIRDYKPMQAGDVVKTAADITALKTATGFTPSTVIEEGVPKFVDWYRKFYN
ncbi:MAG: NAD-dependent epimerase [Alphaproteobacteria bacterium]|nr:NAD-dependent epimerase [Alphaproteobacteria bacterium]